MNIEHISYYTPNKMTKISDLCQKNELSDEEASIFEKLMGLQQVPRDPNKTPHDHIRTVLTLFLHEKNIDTGKVRYVFMSHTADYIVPFQFNLSQLITKEFQFSNAICFSSVINKCASPFHFFKLANTLFQSLHPGEFILIINSDTAFTDVIKTISGSTVMGDAASVILLSKTAPSHRFLGVEMDVNAQFYSGVFGCNTEKLLFQSLYSEKLCGVINSVIKQHKLERSQIKLILPHNVNTFSWKMMAQKMGFPIEKIFLDNVKKLGHCFGSDPFINLKEVIDRHLIVPGDYYLLTTVGLGATFSALLFQY